MAAPWELHADHRTLADIALALVAVLAMPALSALRGRRIGVARPASLLPLYAGTIARGVAIMAAVAVIWWAYNRDLRALGLDWPIGGGGLIGLGIVAALVLLAALQIWALGAATRGRLEQSLRQIDSLKIMPRTGPETAAFLAVSVSAGIWEELLYRGFLIWFFAPFLGIAGSAAIATVIFGLGHIYQGWAGVLRTGLLGAIFAAGYLLTQSLWWLIAAHALVDIFGGLVTLRIRSLARREGLI